MDRFTWTVRVGTAAKGVARAYARKHSFDVGLALHFDIEYSQITALEYLLGALGADLVNGIQALGRKRRVLIDAAEAVIEGELNNPLVHLGVVGEAGHPGLERIGLTIYVSTLADEAELQPIWEEVLQRSPLYQTLRRAVAIDLRLEPVL